MRKFIVFLLLSVLIGALLWAETKAYTDDGKEVLLHDDGTWEYVTNKSSDAPIYFRNTKWGMSVDEVKKAEGGEPSQSQDNVLLYEDTVAGMSAYVVYIFAKGKLVRAKYTFTESHMNDTDHISDYENVKEILINKYGEPDNDRTIWKNDLYKNDPQYYGTALSMGHLVYYCEWKNDDVAIVAWLSGDNFDVSHQVEYQSEQLKHLEAAEREEKANNDF